VTVFRYDAREAIASARAPFSSKPGLRALEAALDKELVDSFAEAIRLSSPPAG
jgi:hypothetical protein